MDSATTSKGQGVLAHVPLLGGWCRFLAKRRQGARAAAALRAELKRRPLANTSWIKGTRQREAYIVLCNILQTFGLPTDKIIAEDRLNVLATSKDDLQLIDLQFDLEEWLHMKIDSEFFNCQFLNFSFGEAVAWLAQHYTAERKGSHNESGISDQSSI